MLPFVSYLKQTFVVAYKLNFIDIGYKQDLYKFENIPLDSKFFKAVSRYFIFLMYTFAIKRQKKKYALICVSSFNSINSAWIYNMDTMPKMAIVITIIPIAIIMIKVFTYFYMLAFLNL